MGTDLNVVNGDSFCNFEKVNFSKEFCEDIVVDERISSLDGIDFGAGINFLVEIDDSDIVSDGISS